MVHFNGRQSLLDIQQKLERNADGFVIAAQGGDRVSVAMIICAAAEEQTVSCRKRL